MQGKMFSGKIPNKGNVKTFQTPEEKPPTRGPMPPDPGKVATEHDYHSNAKKGGLYNGKKPDPEFAG